MNTRAIGQAVIVLLSLATLLVCTACASRLPADAKAELDQWMADVSNPSYRIVSARKGTHPGTWADEVWCVVVDPPAIYVYPEGMSHWTLMRRGLLWVVNYTLGEGDFLVVGCDNW